MDVIRIRRLELDCIVGIRPQEREHRQRVRLDVGLHADLSSAGRTGRISLTADYDQVAHEVAQLLSFRHYHLIEMAAEEVSAMLLGVHSLVQRVDLRIEKPGALEGRARAASVEVRRTREDFPVSVQQTAYGQHEVLLETREARLELLRLQPGQSTSHGPGFAAQCLYWLLSGSIDGEGGSVKPELPAGANLSSSDSRIPLHNPGPETACLFRCWKRSLPSH
jgi:FolB domain-containing protein